MESLWRLSGPVRSLRKVPRGLNRTTSITSAVESEWSREWMSSMWLLMEVCGWDGSEMSSLARALRFCSMSSLTITTSNNMMSPAHAPNTKYNMALSRFSVKTKRERGINYKTCTSWNSVVHLFKVSCTLFENETFSSFSDKNIFMFRNKKKKAAKKINHNFNCHVLISKLTM